MKIKKSIYPLNNENLASYLADIENLLKNLKVEKKEKIRIPLAFEEILLNIQDKFGENAEVFLFIEKNLRRYNIALQFKGEQFNPLIQKNEDEENIFLLTPFLRELSMVPIYSYQHGVNKISLVIREKESFLKKIALYSLSALFLAFIGNLFIPEYFNLIRSVLIKPACDAFLGILTLLCGPLIFFSICTGILSISTNAGNTSGIGTQIVSLYLKRNVLALLFFAALLCFYYPVSFSKMLAVDAESILKEMSKLLFDIIPSNIFDPFLQGNTIQISVLAVAAGLVFLAGSKKYSSLVTDVIQLNAFFQNLMNIVGRYSHLFVFILLLSLPLDENSLFSIDVLQVFLFFTAGCALYVFLMLMYLSKTIKKNPLMIFKAILPAALLGLATSSSTVAYHEMMRSCLEDFKLNKNITEFSIPMGFVLSKDGEIPALLTIAFFTAFMFHTEITLFWIIFSCLSIYILAIATPPVAGCLLIILPALFSQIHISMDAMPIAMVCALFFDFLLTAAKVACIILYTAEAAYKNNLIISMK